MASYPSERTIVVSRHAVLRMRDRLRDTTSLPDPTKRIEELVRCGIESGQIHERKPDDFLFYGEPSKPLPPRQRFVWCPDEPRLGFIIERDPGGLDTVLTTLTRKFA